MIMIYINIAVESEYNCTKLLAVLRDSGLVVDLCLAFHLLIRKRRF